MKSRVQFRTAQKDDVSTLVEMLADDPLGAQRERFELPLPKCYLDAFEAIDSDPNNELVVATVDTRIVGVMQLTMDKVRPDALRFYENLGFTASHEGMKLHLGRPTHE